MSKATLLPVPAKDACGVRVAVHFLPYVTCVKFVSTACSADSFESFIPRMFEEPVDSIVTVVVSPTVSVVSDTTTVMD